jgi:hypothetical protein
MVYLQPGLTAAQRSAVLRRLRQEAQRGCGPQLPSRQLAVAVVADRARSAVRQVLAIIRLHPTTPLAPALLLGVTAGLFLLVAAVPAQVPRQSGPSAVSPARVATMIGGTVPIGPGRTLGRLREYFRMLSAFWRNVRPAKRAAAPGPREGRFLEQARHGPFRRDGDHLGDPVSPD